MSSGIYRDSYNTVRWCNIESIEGEDCTFEGEVEVTFDPEVGSAWWDCPLCGYEHVEEGDDDDDYDA